MPGNRRHRKTGYRWRAEVCGIPPVLASQNLRTGPVLSLLQRQQITTLRPPAVSLSNIARRYDHNRYDADLAYARACRRARPIRSGRLSRDPAPAHTKVRG